MRQDSVSGASATTVGRTLGWKDYLSRLPESPPKGYSTAEQIAAKTGLRAVSVRERMRLLGVPKIRIRVNGHNAFAYKD